MIKTSDVAVVIPTYNRKTLLSRAVLCAALQSFPPREIIVVDDGSTDGTDGIVDRLKNYLDRKGLSQSRIIYHRESTNRGANCARNKGIKLASAKYIAFLDSDDLWHENKLEFQLGYARRKNRTEKLLFTDRIRVNDHLKLVGYGHISSDVITHEHIISSNKIGPLSSVVIERDLLNEIGGFDEGLRACQDWDVYIRALEHTDGLRVPLPLIAYFDCRIPRISSNHRARIQARVGIHRRYAKGRISKEKKCGYYINISDDLKRLGKKRLSKKFYLAYYTNKRRFKLINRIIAHIKYHTRPERSSIHLPHNAEFDLKIYVNYYKDLAQRLENQLPTPMRQAACHAQDQDSLIRARR